MKLSDLKQGDTALILNIDANSELKSRLYAFGIMPREEVKIISCSLAKQTIEIDVDGTLIALRRDEADKIEVSKVE